MSSYHLAGPGCRSAAARVPLATILGLAAVAPAACALGACAGRDASLLAEERGGRIVELPVAAFCASEFTGQLDGEALRRLGASAVFKGMSGAPVFRNDQLVGGVSANLEMDLGIEAPCTFAVTPVTEIRRWIDVARAATRGQPQGPDCGSSTRVRPGSLVAAYTVWGFVHFGPVGCVTLVEDGWVGAFAHAIERRRGTRVMAMLAADPLAIACANDEHAVLATVGEPVGTFLWHGPGGLVGREGMLPPHVRIEFRWCLPDFARSEVVYAVVSPEAEVIEPVCDSLASLLPATMSIEVAQSTTADYCWLRPCAGRSYESIGTFPGLHEALSGTLRRCAAGKELVLCIHSP